MKTKLLLVFILLITVACAPKSTKISTSNQDTSKTETTHTQSHNGFIRKTFYSGKVSIFIPKKFHKMSEKMARLKYPSGRRPNIIYTNDAGSVNVALNYTQDKMTVNQIGGFEKAFKKSFSNRYPSATWYQDKVMTLNGRKVAVLEFMSPAVDTKIYNLLFFTEMDGRMLLATFNCTRELKKQWGPKAKIILHSLKVQE